MKTKMNLARGGGASTSKKLLAAIAVLAVAFVVFAAIPAVDADGTTVADASGFWTSGTDGKNVYGADVKTAGEVTTVTLQKDVKLETYVVLEKSGAYNVVLNGFTISRSAGENSTIFYAPNEGSKLTIDGTKDGSMITSGDRIVSAFDSADSFELIVNGGTYTGGYTFIIGAKSGNSGTMAVEFTNAVINATGPAIWLSYGQMDTALIRGCTITGSTGIYCATFGGERSSTVTVDESKNITSKAAAILYNNTVTATAADESALEIKSGSVEVIGGKYSAPGFSADATDVNGNGTGAGCATIVINNKYCASGNVNSVDVKITDAEVINNTKEDAPILVVAAPSVTEKNISLVMDRNYGVEIGLGSSSSAVDISAAGVSGKFNANTTGEVKYATFTEKSVVFATENDQVVIAKGSSFNGNVKFTTNGIVSSANVKIKADEGGFTLQAGSIDFFGAVAEQSGNAITIVSGEAKISGDYTIPKGMTLTVNAGAILAVGANTLKVSEGAKLSVAGDLTTAGSGKVDNAGTVETLNGGNLNGATISGNGKTAEKTDDSQKENINIAGIVKGTANVYDVDQIVTITGDTSLDYNAMLTINGTLVVKEGVTLTLKAGSKLVLDSNAVLDIQGNVIVEEKYDGEPAEILVSSGTVYVYGTLDVNGTLNVTKGTLVVKQDGILNILDEGNFTAASVCKVSVEKSGTLAISGSTGVMTIDNAGTIVYNSDVKTGNTTINMLNGASLDVQKVTLLEHGTITVEDTVNSIVLKATTVDDGSYTPVGTAYVAAVISGVKISETITAGTTTTYNMTISGNVAVDSTFVSTGSEDGPSKIEVAASMTVNGTSTVDKSGIAVADGLTVGKDVTLINAGKLDVKVAISAEKGVVENNGTITVSDNGSIVTKTEIKATAGSTGTPVINAAKYVVAGATGEKDTLYYVSLDAALAAAASNTTKTITVLGAQTLTASAELVSGATLDVNGAAVTIGSGDSAADVVLTVKSGATVKGTPASIEGNSTITVKGTVFAEKKTDLKDSVRTALTYGADVYTEELDEKEMPVRDGWAKWTNVATAMADPTVTVVKLTKGLIIESDLVIPEGKTLDTNGKSVEARKNVTITVEGTLDINGGSEVTLAKIEGEGATDKSASIVVKGLIQSDSEIRIKTATVEETPTVGTITLLGAYYQVDGKYCMTTVEKAAPLLSTVDGQTITIKGESADKLSVPGDISFADKSATEAGTIDVQLKDVTFSGSVALDNAMIKFHADAKVSGTFSNASGSVALKGKTVSTSAPASDYAFIVASATNDGAAILTVKGSLTDIDSENKQTFSVTGAVTIDGATFNYAIVDGTLTVKSNSTIVEDLKVNGTISVSAGAKLDASKKATILGTVTVAPATTSPVASAGEFSAKILYVGIEESNIYKTAGSAVISGAITVSDYALVAPGSEIPEVFTTSAYKSTEFYKDGALYVTGYANASAITISGLIKNVKVTKDNAYFGGWKDDNGNIATTETIGAVPKVTADFETKIYVVKVYADAAVDNLYIDGNLMTNDREGAFVTVGDSKLEAGAHTFTYTLRNGYSGTGTFKIISEGKSTINGSTLTLAGTPTSADGITVELQLTGFTASGYVDPTPTPAPSIDDDDGLSITDYLLIVLVILIVIMAVIVAMRLMRS